MKRSDEACLEHILPPRHSTAAGGSTSVQTIRPNGRRLPPGITSRGNSINEQSQEYYDMAGRGVAESEVTGVSVSRTFTGFRRFGDAAQDAIMDRLYDLDNRKVKFIECYDNLGSGQAQRPSGRGRAVHHGRWVRRRPKPAKTSASASRSWALPKRELSPSVRTARPRFRRRPQRQRRRRNERGV